MLWEFKTGDMTRPGHGGEGFAEETMLTLIISGVVRHQHGEEEAGKKVPLTDNCTCKVPGRKHASLKS